MNTIDNFRVRRVKDSKTEQKYALVTTSESVYKADITNSGSAFVNTFLAIRKKSTNEIQLVQVQEASFQHTIYDSKHSKFEQNIIDAKRVLHKEFGGKKALASYERINKTKPNVDVLEETLEKHLDSLETDKLFEQDIFDQSHEERDRFKSSIFPDIDTSMGASVRDVFTSKKLLGQEMMAHLFDISIQVLQSPPDKLPFVNSFLKSTVRSIQIKKQPDSRENLEKVSLMIYIDALINLINCRKRTLENVELSKFSAQVERDIQEKFSIQGNMTNSKFTRQKGIIYYIILLLISTESLKIELDQALEGIDVSKVELLKYATVIGAKVKDKKTLYIQKANLDTQSQLSAGMPPAKRRRK